MKPQTKKKNKLILVIYVFSLIGSQNKRWK